MSLIKSSKLRRRPKCPRTRKKIKNININKLFNNLGLRFVSPYNYLEGASNSDETSKMESSERFDEHFLFLPTGLSSYQSTIIL